MSYIGVVLMGGQSIRMGTDKAFLKVKDQYYYQKVAQILAPFCQEIILSVNKAQAQNHIFENSIIIDNFENQGPIGGILSVSKLNKGPLLILAADLVHMQDMTVKMLIDLHTENNGVSLFYNEKRDCYEPLLSIWEQPMLTELETYFNRGNRSLQKFLIQNFIPKHLITEMDSFYNVNTPPDMITF
jgi:molybdopterin-guanine dinucleotide biosynthesis protein A